MQVQTAKTNKVKPKATKWEGGHFPGEEPVSQNTNVYLTLGYHAKRSTDQTGDRVG